jgi:hypothetical protein
MSVTAFCDAESLPSWTIRNNSPFNMREPRNFFLLAGDGDDDSCALDTVGRDPDGSFFLLAGQEITGRFRNIDFSQPQRICVQQSPGPLRKAFASAVIGRNGNGCATALNPDGEPWGDAVDTDTADSFDSVNTGTDATVPATAGYVDTVSITLTNADSIAAGDLVRFRLTRAVANAADTATGDCLALAIEIQDAG